MNQYRSILVALATIFILGLTNLLFKVAFREPPVTPRVTITIAEGLTVPEINEILVEKGVLVGELLPQELEGYLFPDTYEFFLGSSLDVVKEKFSLNFNSKIRELGLEALSEDELKEIIIIASMIEAEVPHSDERRIVSGIIKKRLSAGIPLQLDASLCYVKGDPCLPITDDDKKIDSLYNTYLHRGLTPGPIGNPGLDAIEASINPEESPYLYYISDPETGRTIFASSLDEHNSNVVKYLDY